MDQGLAQLDAMGAVTQTTGASIMNATNLCTIVKEEYSKVSASASLLLLVINKRAFWEPGCHCCTPEATATTIQIVDPLADGAIADRVMTDTGLEEHELAMFEIYDG